MQKDKEVPERHFITIVHNTPVLYDTSKLWLFPLKQICVIKGEETGKKDSLFFVSGLEWGTEFLVDMPERDAACEC